MRRRARSMGRQELVGGSGFTARQTTVLVLGVLLAGLLAPVGARAAQVVSAIITDPGGANQALVDAQGQLHTTSADDPGRMAFQDDGALSFDPGQTRAFFHVVVPEGKRLVITHVSGDVLLPLGQRPIEISLVVSAGGPAGHSFVPAFTGTATQLFNHDVFAFSQDTTIYADGQFSIAVDRDVPVGSGSGRAAISGYLIDCSAATCN